MELENKLIFMRNSKDVKLPCKDDENAGYDIYAFFEEEEFVILPHTTAMIPTGLRSAISEDYFIRLAERGSTGVRGIAQRAGIIDSGFRGEWFVPVTNTNDKKIIISKKYDKVFENDEAIYYTYSKAICQALVLPVPKMEVIELSKDEYEKLESKRGAGALGSSGK